MTFPLELLEPALAARTETWSRLGLVWRRRPVSANFGKPVAITECESSTRLAAITVWSTGEAEWETVRLRDDEVVNKHYDLASREQLERLLDELGANTDPELMVRVGAIAGTGRVMGISARPMTADGLPPGPRQFKPDPYYPDVSYFNASVSAFVEVAWRWYAADQLIGDHPALRAPNARVE